MISKELLQEVLRDKQIDKVDIVGNTVWFKKAECKMVHKWDDECINIYELAFNCKEWIISKDYHINTSEDSINNYMYLYKMVKNSLGYEIDKSNGVQFDSKGYIKNLFKACQWILDNLKDNK